MKELRIELRIKNKLLYDAITEQFSSIAKFCDASHTTYTTVCAYVSLSRSPYRKNATFTSTAWKIADFLFVEPEILFPEKLYNIVRNKIIIETGLQNVDHIRSARSLYNTENDGDLKDAVNSAILTLTPREQDIIRKHFFEGKSFQQIGDEYNCHRERIRQIELKALAKLRHSSREKFFKGYI